MKDDYSKATLQKNRLTDPLLNNYHLLVQRVDDWLMNIDNEIRQHMKCRPGCSSCCKNFTVYSVEAYSISLYLKRNITDSSATCGKILNEQADKEDTCIFLNKDLCTIYPVRPLICRTHGYPVVIKNEKEARVDCCPENFQKMTLKREHLIDIDHLNTMLFSINTLFVREYSSELSADLEASCCGKETTGKNSCHEEKSNNKNGCHNIGVYNNERVSFHEIVMAV